MLFFVTSCVDETVIEPEPPKVEEEFDPNVPDEIRNGFSISFDMSLAPVGGSNAGSRAISNVDLLEIDNFVDLEKVRILFFACPGMVNETDNPDDNKAFEPNQEDYSSKSYIFSGEPGQEDFFLFESKSRWVSELESSTSTESRWQITSPVFTYGNNDEYRWDDIIWTLKHYPFKIAILVNRPDNVNFGNFDDKFGGIIHFTTDRGPNWGPKDTWIPPARRKEEELNINWNEKPTINDLHHCQWDAVYASKNSGDKTTFEGGGTYSFIMKNPTTDNLPKNSTLPYPQDGVEQDPVGQTNMMGALSYWTEKSAFTSTEGETVTENHYFHPNKIQGIPMYGVQIFDPIPDWTSGTAYNISNRQAGQTGAYASKNIHLIRSLVKLELRIPKKLNINGELKDIIIAQPILNYSNVMARCEPLDVATPVERIWEPECTDKCEWQNIHKYGPIITTNSQAQPAGGATPEYLQKQYAWFYGAWKGWWHFNDPDNLPKDVETSKGLKGGANSKFFDDRSKQMPYPRIYNPVIQRNGIARIDPCLVEDNNFWYFVIYTGERNINDPSTFARESSLKASDCEIPFFSFILKEKGQSTSTGTTFCIALTDYQKNDIIKNWYKIGDTNLHQERTISNVKSSAKIQMSISKNENDWSWPLLRNHCYTFIVNSLGNYSDPGGLDVKVVSTEYRQAPTLEFY